MARVGGFPPYFPTSMTMVLPIRLPITLLRNKSNVNVLLKDTSRLPLGFYCLLLISIYIYISIHLFIYLSIHSSIYLSIYLSIHPFIYLFTFLICIVPSLIQLKMSTRPSLPFRSIFSFFRNKTNKLRYCR